MKKEVIVTPFLVAFLLITGCQQGYVGSRVNPELPDWYCNSEQGAGDPGCTQLEATATRDDDVGFASGRGREGRPIQLGEQVVEAERIPIYGEESARRGLQPRTIADFQGYGQGSDVPRNLLAGGDAGTPDDGVGIPGFTEIGKESFEEMKKRARCELERYGITSEQREAYKSEISELIYQSIKPTGDLVLETSLDILPNFIFGREQSIPEREDAWRLYLGLPQEHDTFGISDYQPSITGGERYYYKINIFLNPSWRGIFGEETDARKALQVLLLFVERRNEQGLSAIFPEDVYGVMHSYKLSKGKDEKGDYLSYYDAWDLHGKLGNYDFLGKPFEIYDRIYYDPETFEILDPQLGQEDSGGCN